MPLHSVEGTFDAATDTAVRSEWAALADAGLPSQARHTGATNAPHVTLALAGGVPEAALADIVRALAGRDGVPVRLGPLLVLGARRFALARLVVPSVALLRLHEAVAAAVVGLPDVPEQVLPGRWTPHVTIARGLTPSQVAEALGVLGRVPPLDGAVESVRRWDPDAGRAWQVGGLPTMGP